MAKPKKGKNKNSKAKDTKKKKSGSHSRIFSVLGLVMAGVFMPTTVLLIVGMLPTMVAIFVDRTRQKNRAVTVGAINLAGCTPFLLELWSQGHSLEKTLFIVSDPMAIVVMYSAAAVGYMIDWAMTGLISSFLYNRGQKRIETVKKRQKDLVERWGQKVTGSVPLDQYGFPVHDQNQTGAPVQATDNKQ
ncbi:MAG: hypothetical protein KDJ35_08800 [Alphaproteobacteria bacterium]|nr:hypothetical protein [Alphaproteobacteria bacterium]